MTEREQKLQRTLEWLIDLIEDAVNKTDDYCREKCPVRDHDRICPAISMNSYFDDYGDDEPNSQWDWERDYQECMKLRVEYFVEKANERLE